MGQLESENAIFSLYSPVEGKVAKINPKVFEDCTFINQNADCFWILEYKVKEASEIKDLLKEEEYSQFTEDLEIEKDKNIKNRKK